MTGDIRKPGGKLGNASRSWRAWANRLRTETHALYLAYRDPRVPWYAKLVAAAVVLYALSPVDLVPDFIPVLGYLDDLLIIPAGVYLALKLLPRGVLQECREKAVSCPLTRREKLSGALLVAALWLLGASLALYLLQRFWP